jgi:hypothetical protein
MAEDNLNPAGDNSNPIATDWRGSFDVGIKDHPSLGVFKSEDLVEVPRALVKSYVGQQALIGKDKIPLPGEKATDDDWNIVFDRLGRPKTADEYKLPELKSPEGFPVSEELTKSYRTWAHEAGLNPKQTATIYQKFMEAQFGEYSNAMANKEKGAKDAETALRTEWGKAYEQNLALAKKVFNTYGDKEITAMMEEGLGNDPRILRIFAKIGSKMGEDGIQGKGGSFMMTPTEASSEITKIMGAAHSDPKHPYINRDHPEHKLYVQRMADLQALAHPDKLKN